MDLQRLGIAIPCLDETGMRQAQARQDRLTKPLGSLGRLEALSVRLAGIKADPRPGIVDKAVVVMAADHGVARRGVSAYPPEVTAQMVDNFLAGRAAINVLARLAGARMTIVDVGVASDMRGRPGLLDRKVAFGTADFTEGPAMTSAQAERALQVGVDVVLAECDAGLDLVATGEMGIGNTTSSSAVIAAVSGLPAAAVTGRGTGVDDAGLARKVEVVEKALAVNRPDPADAFDVLCKVGGLEIAGLAGVILGAASRRVPVLVDGFISSAAAVIAAGLAPEVRPFLIASHLSVEVGHKAMLDHLGLDPLLDLDLQLGEGTGAVLAFPVVEAAALILSDMATFAEAGVAERGD